MAAWNTNRLPSLCRRPWPLPLPPPPAGTRGLPERYSFSRRGASPRSTAAPATLEGLSLSHWRLDAGDAAALVAEWRSRATPLVVDYEHQTQLAAHNGQPAPAAGWLTSLRWEDGRGLFASVDWTDRARAHIRAGEYRYISPVFCFDPQSGAVLRLVCAALTNHPALDGMAAARATLSPREESP